MEEQEGVHYEFYNGEVVTMAGSSLNHNRIASNISGLFLNAFLDQSYKLFQEGVKLEHERGNVYVYLDIMVTCNQEDISASN